MSLSFEVHGSGPGLLLAHGAGGSVAANFPFIAELAEKRTVIAPDYPGSGATPKAEQPLELDRLVDDVVATAVDSGVETFAVLGYSTGAAVAVRAAARYPERVTALVLTAGLAHTDQHLHLNLDVWQHLLDTPEALAPFLVLNCFGPEALNSIDDLDGVLRGAADGVPVGTRDHIDLLRTVDVRADLPGVTVPTLVVATTQDTLVPPHHSRGLASAIPGAKLVEVESGHLIGVQNPDDWLAAIQEFLG
ncbi:Pimeloyl-ACP methyl ester carboxylesterase [Saccharopolyspora antimicrobica]|uniref:Pimeloyl-ACP methyl ester carboxylesterase n=1 Tax=Saccharopolyspora antimicrobica TaxID=455193 RepID=A0A1I4ZXV3_9PSEU|nr:alpha/beta hydrolase [Saccharopolyspora antimicrobica]RKT83360.1 pimeloyl-ACP methyl ester carboxylesterase [Saccharopolyspora antimicrobica]SFN54900.1 Pimeloyl-ACP methyl ester carboxylesterase [Saccharopolyspora antimicrobica]